MLRSNGTLVRPRVRREATLGRVHPVRRSAIGRRATAGSTTAAPTTGQPTSVTPPTPDTPAYLEQAYDLSYLSQTGGTGDTVGIVDAYDDPTAQSDLDTYRSNYGLPACDSGCFTKVNESGNASPLPAASSDWDTEISLDLDTVSAICPNCHILLVEASSSNESDLQAAMQTAARLHANQISDSWTLTRVGACEQLRPLGRRPPSPRRATRDTSAPHAGLRQLSRRVPRRHGRRRHLARARRVVHRPRVQRERVVGDPGPRRPGGRWIWLRRQRVQAHLPAKHGLQRPRVRRPVGRR